MTQRSKNISTNKSNVQMFPPYILNVLRTIKKSELSPTGCAKINKHQIKQTKKNTHEEKSVNPYKVQKCTVNIKKCPIWSHNLAKRQINISIPHPHLIVNDQQNSVFFWIPLNCLLWFAPPLISFTTLIAIWSQRKRGFHSVITLLLFY